MSGYLDSATQGRSCGRETGDLHAPVANTAAVITYAGVSGQRHVVGGVAYSYSEAPAAGTGRLTISDGGVVVFDVNVTASGPGFIPFPGGLRQAAVNTSLVITLAAGGGTCVGKVNALSHWLE